MMDRQGVIQESGKFDGLREASPNGVFAMTATEIVYANPAGLRLLGATEAAQIVGHHPAEFQDPQDDRVGARRYFDALETGDASPLQEQRLRRIDGRFVDVEVVAISGNFDGEMVVETIVRDISEKKRLVNALKTIASLGRATQTMSDRETVLHTSLDIVYESFSAHGAAIILKDSHGAKYVNGFTRGILSSQENITAILEEGRLKAVCAAKVIAQYENQLLLEASLQTLIAVPLLAENEVVAMLWLARPEKLGDFELALMDSIRIHTGVNVQRAVLSDSLRRNVESLESLRTIDQAINASLELELILNLLLDEVLTRLDVDAACVLLPVGEDRLSVRAQKGFSTQLATGVTINIHDTWAGQALLQRQLVEVTETAGHPATKLLTNLINQEDFHSYFGYPLLAQGEAIGVLEVFTRKPVAPDAEWKAFLGGISHQAAIAIKKAELFVNLRSSKTELEISYEMTIQGWMRALELRDHETEGHTARVTEMTVRLAQQMGVVSDDLADLRRGALMHDIGKIGVPDSILLKPGPLDERERTAMQKHTIMAEQMLAPIPFLRGALAIPLNHHERWDGTGYPRGLKGVEIPFHARIFAIVDVWDALTSDRPYRKAWSRQQAWEHILSQSGRHFDPAVVRAFEAMRSHPGASNSTAPN